MNGDLLNKFEDSFGESYAWKGYNLGHIRSVSTGGLSGRDLKEMFCTKYPVVLSRLLHSMVIFTVIMINTFLC